MENPTKHLAGNQESRILKQKQRMWRKCTFYILTFLYTIHASRIIIVIGTKYSNNYYTMSFNSYILTYSYKSHHNRKMRNIQNEIIILICLLLYLHTYICIGVDQCELWIYTVVTSFKTYTNGFCITLFQFREKAKLLYVVAYAERLRKAKNEKQPRKVEIRNE